MNHTLPDNKKEETNTPGAGAGSGAAAVAAVAAMLYAVTFAPKITKDRQGEFIDAEETNVHGVRFVAYRAEDGEHPFSKRRPHVTHSTHFFYDEATAEKFRGIEGFTVKPASRAEYEKWNKDVREAPAPKTENA